MMSAACGDTWIRSGENSGNYASKALKTGLREITSRDGKIKNNPMEVFRINNASFEAFPSENRPFFPAQEPRKIYEKQEDFMKTGLTKKQKTTDIYYNAKEPPRIGLHPRTWEEGKPVRSCTLEIDPLIFTFFFWGV